MTGFSELCGPDNRRVALAGAVCRVTSHNSAVAACAHYVRFGEARRLLSAAPATSKRYRTEANGGSVEWTSEVLMTSGDA